MAQLTYPFTRINKSTAIVVLAKSLYSVEAIHASAYKFSGDFFVYLSDKGDSYEIFIEKKDGGIIEDQSIKSICNDFIDQQIRVETEKQFGYIRDLIVEEAFKPVNK